MEKQKIKIYYFRESAFQSFLSDFFSFFFIFLLGYINFNYLGNKWYYDIFNIILFLVIATRTTRTKIFHSIKDFKKHVADIEE